MIHQHDIRKIRGWNKISHGTQQKSVDHAIAEPAQAKLNMRVTIVKRADNVNRMYVS